MREIVSNAAKRVAYAFLSLAVYFRECWLRFKTTLQETWSSLLTSSPRIESLLHRCASSFRARRERRQRGTVPRSPAILGAVVVQSTFGQQDDQALCRLLAWAQLKGFKQVLLYDPAGEIQLRKDELIESLRWVDSSKKIQVWSGWQNDSGSSGGGGEASSEESSLGAMGVALLSAADAEEPLLKAAAVRSQQTADHLLDSEENRGLLENSNNARLDVAVAAPLDIKTRLAAVSGPLAGVEPDIVVVFGPAFTLAGFPPWAVRTAELFEVGALAAVTSGKMDAVLRRYLGTRQRFGK